MMFYEKHSIGFSDFRKLWYFRFSQVLIIFDNHRLLWQKGPRGERAATGRGLFGILCISELIKLSQGIRITWLLIMKDYSSFY